MSEDFSAPEGPRRRTSSTEITASKAAMLFASKYRPQLETWYNRVAYLRARAMRSELTYVRSEARTMLVEVIGGRKRFAENLAKEPDATRAHSIVRDLERGLLRLEEELRSMGGVTH